MKDKSSSASSVVLVTGSASGIGRAVVEALNCQSVVTVGLDMQQPHESLSELAHLVVADVCDEGAVDSAVMVAEAAYGPITGLVNAAGILGKVHAPERVRIADWNREISVDLTGTFIVSKIVGSKMAARGQGSIVNVASIAGITSAPTHAYSAAKAGVISLTRTLAAAWGRRGVRVNAVSPGFTRTAALLKGLEAGVLQESTMADACAMGRLLDPSEIADAIIWLLSPASRAVTGINLPVDGGFLAGVTWHAYGVNQ